MSRHEYSPHVRNALSQLGWHGRLNAATSEDDVVAITRDYVALWSPEELVELPADLRPSKIVDAGDVNDYALALVQAQMGQSLEAESSIHKMGDFFTSASLRLTQLLRSKEVASN